MTAWRLTTLKWMMDEAEACGLRYDKLTRDEMAARANPDGEQYDSRAGIAGYCRYGPRNVAALCADKYHGVNVPIVHVHPAAFERIAAWRRDYEPVSLGAPFSVAGAAKPAADSTAMENAWDMVWWRRLAYFTTLALTAFVGFALRLVFGVAGVHPDGHRSVAWRGVVVSHCCSWCDRAGWIGNAWNWLLDHLGSVLPDWASPTVPSFWKYPLSGIVSLALLAWAFFFLVEKIGSRLAEWAWAGHKRLAAAAQPKTDWHNVVARALRPVTAFLYRWLWRGVFVPVLGIGLGLAALMILSPYWIWRTLCRRPWMA